MRFANVIAILSLLATLMVIGCKSPAEIIKEHEEDRVGKWPAPTTTTPDRGTLEEVLEFHFKTHAENCDVGSRAGSRDYIPRNDIRQLRGSSDLKQKVQQISISGKGLLFYVYSNEDVRLSFDEMESRMLATHKLAYDKLGLTSEFQFDPDDDFPTYIMRRSCSQYIQAALKAGAEPPYAEIKAALDADRQRSSSLAIVEGRFVSPLFAMLKGNTSQSIHAKMQIWQIYHDTPSLANGSSYLKEFSGLMIKRIGSDEKNFRTDLNASFDVKVPFVSASGSVRAGLQASDYFGYTDWQTVIYTKDDGTKRQAWFEPLPTVPNLKSDFATMPYEIGPIDKESAYLSSGKIYRHYVALKGVPQGLCESQWRLVRDASDIFDNLSLVKTEYIAAGSTQDGQPICKCFLEGLPKSDFFSRAGGKVPSSSLKLAYTLRNKVEVGEEHIDLRIESVVNTTQQPLITINSGPLALSIVEQASDGKKFRWEALIGITDADNRVNVATGTEGNVLNATLLSEGVTYPVQAKVYAYSENPRQYKMEIETEQNQDVRGFAVEEPRKIATFAGDLELPLASGNSAVKSFKVTLSFPARKEGLSNKESKSSGAVVLPGQAVNPEGVSSESGGGK